MKKENHFKCIFLWISLIIQFAQSIFPETFVEVLVGSSAKLPCEVLKKANKDIEFVFWFKSQGRTPLYTMDARERVLSDALHIRNETYDGRVYFYVKDIEPYMLMDRVKEEDSGVYFCRVDYQWTATQVSRVNLTVVVPPKDLIIQDSESRLVRDVAGPYQESSNVTLFCEAHKGTPPANVTWWKDGVLLDSNYVQKNKSVVNALHFTTLNRSDIFTKLECRGQNSKLTTPIIKQVILDFYLYPLTVNIRMKSTSFSTWKTADVLCESNGSRPAAIMSWWLNGTQLTDHTETVANNVTSSILRLHPKAEYHRKALSCRAENPKIRGSSIEESKILNITYVPVLSLRTITEEADRQPKEDDYVRLICDIDANPPVTDVGWYFNGSPLSQEESNTDIVNNNILVFKRLSRLNKGKYKCYAINDEGRGLSKEILLNVSHAPVCKEHQQITYVSALHRSVSIRCEVEAEPAEVVFKWEFTNAIHKHYDLQHTSDGLVSTATYTPVTHADYGTLFCWASNQIGHQLSSCFFTVIAPACASEKIESNASSSKDNRESLWQVSTFTVAGIVAFCLIIASILCAFYYRRIHLKKQHTNIRKILDEEIHIFNRIQVYNSDPTPHIRMDNS